MADRTRWIFAVTGGVIASLAWWLGLPLFLPVCFVPLLLIEDDIKKNGDPVLSVLPFSFAFFFCWNLLVSWWLLRINLLGGLSVILLNALLMSTVFLFFAKIKRITGGGPVVFIILWLSFEYLHYRGDLSWPWLSLGNGLAGNIRLIQWYEFTGTTGGSLWVLVVNVMVFLIIKEYQRNGMGRSAQIVAIILIFFIVFPAFISLRMFSSYVETGYKTRFLILQPCLDPYGDKFSAISNNDRLEQLLKLAGDNMHADVDFIVTPETSVDSLRIGDPDDPVTGRILEFLNRFPNTGFILGTTAFRLLGPEEETITSRIDETGKYFDIYNSAALFFYGEEVEFYHKHYLANGVEQIPFQRFFRLPGHISLDLGGISGSLAKGPGARVFRTTGVNPVTLGTLICFESAYGEYAAKLTLEGADILLVMSNDGWFKNTGAYRQHLRLSQVRAVETRRSIVRAANTGISGHISQRGEIIDRLGWWEVGALVTEVNTSNRITFFSLYGDYTGRTALFFSVLLILNFLARSLRGKLF